MSELTPEIKPDVLDPTPPRRLAGDWSDDDGQALDDYFEYANQGPVATDQVVSDKPAIKMANRLITGNHTDSNNNQFAVLLAPADVKRKSFHMIGIGTFWFAGETFSNPNQVSFSSTSGMFPAAWYQPAYQVLDLNGYTGPVYVCGVDEAVGISWWAVTE